MKILHLTLTKKWFDMIASGEKTEEYRKIKPYWITRLTASPVIQAHPYDYDVWIKHFDAVEFRNGYQTSAPKMIFTIHMIYVGVGISDWGASPGELHFVIKLGDRIEVVSKTGKV